MLEFSTSHQQPTRMGIVGKVSDLTLGRSFRQAHQEQSPAVLVNAYANRGNKTVCFTAP